MTTYLELINAVLLELNYRTVTAFSELIKPDHEKIKYIVNRVNDQILDSYDWDFMQRSCELSIPANADSVSFPTNIKILLITDQNGQNYYYSDDIARFMNGNGCHNEYTIFNERFILKPSPEARTLKIIYTTANHAKSAQNVEKREMTAGDDQTLLPEQYCSTIVFGACLQFKCSTDHPRHKFWAKQYVDTRAQMRAAHGFNPPKPPEFKLPDWTIGYENYRRKMGWL